MYKENTEPMKFKKKHGTSFGYSANSDKARLVYNNVGCVIVFISNS